jgi:hypothetical protein
MSVVLPRELQYHDTPPSLPSGVQNMEQSLLPVNGSLFSCATAGTTVAWDLPARGYAVPDSFYIKYKWAIVGPGAAELSRIRGTPVYAPIQRLETIFASQTVESINNYNMVQNMLTNCTLNIGQKYGLQSGYGYKSVGTVPTMDELDGRNCLGPETGSFAAPLSCLLSNSDKLVPLGMMPNVRIQITLDSIANIFAAANAAAIAAVGDAAAVAIGVLPTGFNITDFQLCYTMIDFGPETDAIVRNMGEKLCIKTQSFTNASTSMAAGVVGSIEHVFSQRLASVKSLFLHTSSPNAAAYNGNFDSFDITNGGDYQFSIAGKYYPPRPIAGTGIMMELKKACGSLADKHNNFSINSTEFSRILVAATPTTLMAPAKCYVGCNTELLPSNGVLLSGTSTQASPITVRLNIAAATTLISSPSLICCYDALIEIHPREKMAIVIQ